MYQKDQARYQEAAKGLAAIIKSGKFSLVSDYASMWLQEGEFGSESIFNTIVPYAGEQPPIRICAEMPRISR